MLLSAFAAQLNTAVIYFCHMLQAKCSTELIIFKIKVMKLFFLFVTSVDMQFWQQTTGNITVDCCLVSITCWSKRVYFYASFFFLPFFFSPFFFFFARLSTQAAAPLSFSSCLRLASSLCLLVCDGCGQHVLRLDSVEHGGLAAHHSTIRGGNLCVCLGVFVCVTVCVLV